MEEENLTNELEEVTKKVPGDNEETVEERISDAEDQDQVSDTEDEEDSEEEEQAEEEDEEELANRMSNSEDARQAFMNIDDEEEEDEVDEMYLQKFNESTQKNIISEFHPELQTHNYDEIDVLSKVVRDENGNIIDPLHKTMSFITRYEKARILGERAKQINSGAKPFVEVKQNIIDGYVIALKEFEEKKIPFIVKRPLPNGAVEYWKFEDLEVLV
jgi:DNA-directed RNA polymerase I, II, and III subunit RPABC2